MENKDYSLKSFPKIIPVKIGKFILGQTSYPPVQTMWKKPWLRVKEKALLNQIKSLQKLGCDILRFAVCSEKEAVLLGRLQSQLDLPLVADIHFDYKLALACLKQGVAKIRINPGNIGSPAKVAEILKLAQEKMVPLRIGINAGSLPKNLRAEKNLVKAMLKSAEEELELLEKYNFKQVVFSFKSSSVETTLEVNRSFRKLYAYPLHIGLTEAGPLLEGVVKSSVAIATLIREGIGETIRVSLAASEAEEIKAGKEILRACGIKIPGVNLVCCPCCGRTVFPVSEFYTQIKSKLEQIEKELTIAIMGCPVNGLGEAVHADLGITGTEKQIIIFKHGKIIRRELMYNAKKSFLEELEKLCAT